jgi:hypothetical protein
LSERGGRVKAIAAVVALVVVIYQVFILMRYVVRLPDDTLGIWMHAITIVLWAILAIVFFIQSRSGGGDT